MGCHTEALQCIQLLSRKSKTWDGKVSFEVADEDKGSVKTVDLVEFTIPHKFLEKLMMERHGCPPHTRVQFPAKHHGIHSKKTLVNDIVVLSAAKVKGQSLFVRQPHEGGTKVSANRGAVATICCDHTNVAQKCNKSFPDGKHGATGMSKGRIHQSKAPQKCPKTHKSSTKKPLTREEECPFQLVVMMDNKGYWHLCVNGWHANSHFMAEQCCTHMNHVIVESQFMNPGSKRLPEAELQL